MITGETDSGVTEERECQERRSLDLEVIEHGSQIGLVVRQFESLRKASL